MAEVLPAVKASIEYIRANIQSHATAEKLAKLQEDQKEHLKSVIAAASIDIHDATACINEITNAPEPVLTKANRDLLMDKIRAQVHCHGSAPKTVVIERGKSQNHMYMENYCRDVTWDQLYSGATSTDKMHVLIKESRMIGLLHPSPPTRLHMITIIAQCSGLSLNPRLAYNMCQQYKDINDGYQKRLGGTPTLQDFPVDVLDFLNAFDDRYPDDEQPVPAKVNADALKEVEALLPLRRSSKLLKDDTVPMLQLQPSGSGQMHPLCNVLNPLMQGLAQLLQGGQAGHDGGVAILPPRQRRRVQSDQLLPLGYSSDSPTDSPPTGARPALADRPRDIAPDIEAVTESPFEEVGDTVPTRPTTASEEVDDLLAKSSVIGKAPAKGPKTEPKPKGRPKKAAAPEKAAAKSKAAAKPATAAKKIAMPKVKAKAKASSCTSWVKPPPAGSPCPLTYNGCKVYRSYAGKGCFRIMPKPGKSVYDKTISIGDRSERDAWKEVLAYCAKPVIPKTSKNFVKD
jgi:hypothetical protein